MKYYKTMKRIFISSLLILIVFNLRAQSPEKMSYQAVIRDANNTLVTNQMVGIQMSILQGSAMGTAVYVETQLPTSNVNGLVSLELGAGTIVSGSFGTIDWSNGPYFVQTETDPTGGTNYTITGTSQLLSVPYALHSNVADSLAGGVAESDPVFASSIANGITAADTMNWNNHTVDTDTQLDSTAIANMGFKASSGTSPVYAQIVTPLATALTTSEVTVGNVKFRYSANALGGYLEGQTLSGTLGFQIYCHHRSTAITLNGAYSNDYYTINNGFGDSGWSAAIQLWDGVGYSDRVTHTFNYQTDYYEFIETSGATPHSYKVFLTIDGGNNVFIRAEYFE